MFLRFLRFLRRLVLLIHLIGRFFILDQKIAKIYTTAQLSRYLLLLLLGLLLPFLLELLLGYISRIFSNLSTCFAPLVGPTMLFFK